MSTSFQNLTKLDRKSLIIFITLNAIWTVIGIYADWYWMSLVPGYLIPFTAICSLYPPLLLIWYVLKFKQIKIPDWFSFWIILGTITYGVLAQLYFPLLMTWKGVNFHDVGSMFWVAVYGLQSIIIFKNTASFKLTDVIFGLSYILFADFSHYFLLTFMDFNLTGYPLWMKYLTGIVGITVQISVFLILIYAKKPALLPNKSESPVS